MDCVVCETPSARPRTHWPELGIVRCPKCGHIFWNGSLPDDACRVLYSERYFREGEYSDYQADRALLQRNFRRRARLVRRHTSGDALLEIGSAYGFFLDLVRDRFRVQGFEICEQAAASAREQLRLPVRSDDFLACELDERFDAVCLWDVIEHLERPDLFLRKIASLMAPGGHLFLTTGDISSPIARLRGRNWRLVHPPTHIHYFGRETIARLLERFGFEIVEIRHPGAWRSFHQLVATLLRWPNARRYIPGAFYLNLYDIMCLVARVGPKERETTL